MQTSDKKKRIYKSAKKLFEKYGIKKVSIDMIVQKAWVAKGTFYLYYKNKHDLYDEIIHNIAQKIKKKITLFNGQYTDIKERLLYDFLWSYEFFESQVIFKQISIGNQDYFSWDINAINMQKQHILFLKSIFDISLNDNIDYNLLAKLMSFYKNIDIIRVNFQTNEEFDKHKIIFAWILIEWFFSDYKKLINTFDKNKINKLIK